MSIVTFSRSSTQCPQATQLTRTRTLPWISSVWEANGTSLKLLVPRQVIYHTAPPCELPNGGATTSALASSPCGRTRTAPGAQRDATTRCRCWFVSPFSFFCCFHSRRRGRRKNKNHPAGSLKVQPSVVVSNKFTLTTVGGRICCVFTTREPRQRPRSTQHTPSSLVLFQGTRSEVLRIEFRKGLTLVQVVTMAAI